MISAAAADGTIDAAEQAAIMEQMDKLDLGDDGNELIRTSLQNPASATELANLADGPEQGAQIYLMALFAIDPDQAAEKAFLEELAQNLGLGPDFVAQLESEVRSVQV